MNGDQDVSSLSESDYQSALQGLSAVRHQAMLSNNRARQKRADNLISEITLLRNRPKPKPQAQPRWTPRTIKFRKAQPSPTSQGPVSMTDAERRAMNEIVDHLLEGHEIDTIEADAIPQLYHILKVRKVMAIDDGSYDDAKILEKNMTILVKMQSQLISERGQTADKVIGEQKVQGVAAEIENSIKNAQKRLGRLQSDLEREEAEVNEMRARCEANIFATLEDMAKELEDEKRELEMGLAFRPSKKLLEMRELEGRLARNSLFDEAAVARRRADQKEILERKEFDRKNRAAIERKEKRFNDESEAKIRCSNEFFAQKLEKLRMTARKDINGVRKEIRSLKDRFEKVTGKNYDEWQEEMEEMALREEEERSQRQEYQEEKHEKAVKHEEEEEKHEEEEKREEEERLEVHGEEEAKQEEEGMIYEGVVVTEVIDCGDEEEEKKEESVKEVEPSQNEPEDVKKELVEESQQVKEDENGEEQKQELPESKEEDKVEMENEVMETKETEVVEVEEQRKVEAEEQEAVVVDRKEETPEEIEKESEKKEENVEAQEENEKEEEKKEENVEAQEENEKEEEKKEENVETQEVVEKEEEKKEETVEEKKEEEKEEEESSASETVTTEEGNEPTTETDETTEVTSETTDEVKSESASE